MSSSVSSDYGEEAPVEIEKQPIIPINIFCEDMNLVRRTESMINIFLATEWSDDGNVIDLNTINQENVTVDMMCAWGTYLLSLKNNKGQPFKQSACFKFLSCLVSTVLRKRFPNCDLFKQNNPNPDWYTRLRNKIGRNSACNSIHAGLAVVDKPYSLGPAMVKKIIHELLKEGTPESITTA
jgi:hypothetical protein